MCFCINIFIKKLYKVKKNIQYKKFSVEKNFVLYLHFNDWENCQIQTMKKIYVKELDISLAPLENLLAGE